MNTAAGGKIKFSNQIQLLKVMILGAFACSRVKFLNFNSSVRAEQSFAIRYPNVVIKSLCGNLDICLNY